MDIEALIPIWLVVCPLVFLAGLVDAVAGGGGLISLPAYILAGLPPHAAIATNKCGNVTGILVTMFRFVKNRQYNAPTIPACIVGALIGAWIGARLSLAFPARYLYYLLLAIVPFLALFLIFKRDFGAENSSDRFTKKALIARAGFVAFTIGTYDGFFGPGTGTFLIMALTGLCGFDLLTASGNTKVINSVSCSAALITYALAGQVIWAVGIPAVLFNIVGSYIGASIALKNGGKVIRPMFIVILLILMCKLVYDLFI